MPFIKVFIKTVHTTAPALTQTVDLRVEPEVVTQFINLITLTHGNNDL